MPMDFDQDKVDQAVPALLSLGRHEGYRTWKAFDCVIHAMSVHDFTACRSSISRDAGQGFHAMSVQCFMACRSSS